MPYQPTVLKAFLSVGWGYKERWLRTYLRNLQGLGYKFRVLDCLNIKTFGGVGGGIL